MQAKKSLGQNFLIDDDVISDIIRSINPRKGEVIVEIGPGKGVLTSLLAKSGARVFAVELDDRLIPILRETFKENPNVRIHHGNILRTHVEAELESLGWGSQPFRVVGNLPYYITASIVRMILETSPKPTEAYFMVQKEVAERIIAPVGDMSILAVAVRYYADATMLLSVPSAAFDPTPKVESAFIRIVPRVGEESPLSPEEQKERDKRFFRVVRSGFAARRKLLANNLSNSFHMSKDDILGVLRACGVSQTARAQELTVEDWVAVESHLCDIAPNDGQVN